MIRVLLADDHPVVREGLRAVLERAGIAVVGEAGDGAEPVDLVSRLVSDVVLMDLQMPVLDGVTATARIRAAQPGVRVLVLTTFDTDADVLRAVHAGAS